MAYWNKKLTVEVKLPYVTQGCTLDYFTATINILPDDIWITEGGLWKAEVYYGDYKILFAGKSTPKGFKGLDTIWQPTTYKVHAFGECDKHYSCRVVSWE